MKRVAVVGGGIAGLSAAYFLGRGAEAVDVHLFEAGDRLGGTVETVREGGFIVECGPDGWVTEKPWARELAVELGLGDQMIFSLDAGRKTYLQMNGQLMAMPDGMRMMVPMDLGAVEASPLFTEAAKRAYREEPGRAEELKAGAPQQDESIASFVHRHFGGEVLDRIATPLLSGVFGGDVTRLSVQAVMPGFVAMERQFGSLIVALQSGGRLSAAVTTLGGSPEAVILNSVGQTATPIFTTLRDGIGQLAERMTAAIPRSALHLREAVRAVARTAVGWRVTTTGRSEEFDALVLAAPARAVRTMLEPVDPVAAGLMPLEATTCVIAAMCFDRPLALPPGFGFLVAPGESSRLLACTFTTQKFAHRAPPGTGMLRAFFGGALAERMMGSTNDEIAAIARHEVARSLGPLPNPIRTTVRRWPRSLPQYAVGHRERIGALEERVAALGDLWLLGNAYRGVGLPDLVREARGVAAAVARA